MRRTVIFVEKRGRNWSITVWRWGGVLWVFRLDSTPPFSFKSRLRTDRHEFCDPRNVATTSEYPVFAHRSTCIWPCSLSSLKLVPRLPSCLHRQAWSRLDDDQALYRTDSRRKIEQVLDEEWVADSSSQTRGLFAYSYLSHFSAFHLESEAKAVNTKLLELEAQVKYVKGEENKSYAQWELDDYVEERKAYVATALEVNDVSPFFHPESRLTSDERPHTAWTKAHSLAQRLCSRKKQRCSRGKDCSSRSVSLHFQLSFAPHTGTDSVLRANRIEKRLSDLGYSTREWVDLMDSSHDSRLTFLPKTVELVSTNTVPSWTGQLLSPNRVSHISSFPSSFERM